MPAVNVTHNQGSEPVLTGKPTRNVLVLQNNTLHPMRVRLYGAVSGTNPNLSGIHLGARGGTISLSGPSAQVNVYAVHSGPPGTQLLDYESDVL